MNTTTLIYHEYIHDILKKGLKVERLLAVISKLQFCNFEIMEQKEIFCSIFPRDCGITGGQVTT